jgi:hypothetical protein
MVVQPTGDNHRVERSSPDFPRHVVVPDQDMVVVFVSDLEERDSYVPQELLTDFIIPAAKSPTSLSDNPDGVALLKSRTEALAIP